MLKRLWAFVEGTFPAAVARKFAHDRGGLLTAAITYYAFLSAFPLLLAFASVLGFVLSGHAGLQQRIVSSTLAQLPVIGAQLRVGSLRGSGLALGVGLGGALWAGMRAFLVTEQAMGALWGVETRGRLSFVTARLRALGAVAALGAGGVAAFALGAAGAVWSALLSLVVAFAVFSTAYRVLTVADVGWRGVLPGAAFAALVYEALQQIGGVYISHVLAHASEAYGTFALVIGLLSWIYLVVEVTLLGAEVNVVKAQRAQV
jgi:uncharacterized BrkB/YihY/UPF0761 family membrane protein